MNVDNKQFLDITKPELNVTVEIDVRRRVLYVHVDGVTALRICQIPEVIVETHVQGGTQSITSIEKGN